MYRLIAVGAFKGSARVNLTFGHSCLSITQVLERYGAAEENRSFYTFDFSGDIDTPAEFIAGEKYWVEFASTQSAGKPGKWRK